MPLVALVGRPNVGKSTLFNRLIGERRAVVHHEPGTTRDRLYGTVEWRGREFAVVDTGGIGLDTGEGDLLADVRLQAEEAMREADVIVLVLDAQSGLSAADLEVADFLRPSKKPLVVVANKVEGQRREWDASEFYRLGLGDPLPVSAQQGEGTGDLLDAIVEWFPKATVEDDEAAVSIAIVGRPNVGKSSLLNALVGQQRSIVRAEAGTTRDAIDTVIRRDGENIRLIDTAGIRRRGKVAPGVEKFSVLRAIRAVERADVAALVIDASEGVRAQDTHVAGYIEEAAKGMIIVVNKWDLVEKHGRIQPEYTAQLRRELKFADWAPVLFISAKTGQRVQRVIDLAKKVAEERRKRIPTPKLNEVIRGAVMANPLNEKGRPLKIYYSAQTGTEPPTFTCFCNDPHRMHFSYLRYLENRLRDAFTFEGTPLRLQFRGRDDPVKRER